MKRVVFVALSLTAGTVAHAAPGYICEDMPNLNRACIQIGKRAVNKQGNVTVPFVIATPNNTITTEGHRLEVQCSKEIPISTYLQDRNGTRYAGGEAHTMPKHSRALADQVCIWNHRGPPKK